MENLYDIEINSKRLQYKFSINRKLTILRGDSGTGKTQLVEAIENSKLVGSPVTITCDLPLIVLKPDKMWKQNIRETRKSIVIIDEGFEELETADFAREVKNSSNYFLIITRKSLPNLPYSTKEIYEMKSSGKFNSMVPVYENDRYGKNDIKPDIIITEDSNSGYQFFLEVCKGNKEVCVSAGGKSNILNTLKKVTEGCSKDSNILIIADGAAFGNEVKKVYKALRELDGEYNILLYLPESFEYLLLMSDMLFYHPDLIDYPELHGPEYFSRESYFEALLIEITKDTPIMYNKSNISKCFTKRCCYLLGKSEEYKFPCKFKDKNCKTDTDKLYSILKQTGIDFSMLLGDVDIKPETGIKGF